MRPPRIAMLAFFLVACLFILCRAVSSASTTRATVASSASSANSASSVASTAPDTGEGSSSSFSSLFSFSTPFSLFPPNAIITIADDNSTSFAARPAAFGPALPGHGLNGQLWIGSGFTEETFEDGEGEGELGCSDVPGWSHGNVNAVLKPTSKDAADKSAAAAGGKTKSTDRRGDNKRAPLVDAAARGSHIESRSTHDRFVDDGTDDYLHQSLGHSPSVQTDGSSASGSGHADIQSIQEGAEIAGKIVLLSRGGCGFLEKVKWAQRRGAVALIVGDNQRGGPLIQMFARGDSSNVTIPSIFTSRTTAYLLSLMMQPGNYVGDAVNEKGTSAAKPQQSDQNRASNKRRAAPTPFENPKPVSKDLKAHMMKPVARSKASAWETIKPGWVARLFGSSAKSAENKSRSPSNGQLDWVVVEDFSDEEDSKWRSAKGSKSATSKSAKSSEDGFQIGVEDWRDPDLRDHNEVDDEKSSANTKSPGSGDYIANNLPAKDKDAFKSSDKSKPVLASPGGLISKLFGDGGSADTADLDAQPLPIDVPMPDGTFPGHENGKIPDNHQGLWVVITPSSGASPFFDTLLVLVISPLITLTVVYALLILRARIQRRRWRAPKSVVERLPVRTYHTVTTTSSRATTRIPSPTSSSPTTPLLQNQRSAGLDRPRPRSHTTSGIPAAGDILDINAALAMPRPAPQPEHEKRNQWKKYMGRQVECVVCLEEYVDGISQVMSLPCGHEFHVECITPWLTTRRRTCPICKGDVVRSLARGSSSRYEPYQDESDEEEEDATPPVVAEASSSQTTLSPEADTDLERGISSESEASQGNSWWTSLSNTFRLRSPSPAQSDRLPVARDDDRGV